MCVHTAKITATMGRFLWKETIVRVTMMQLARSKENGGLKLQLPALKCKSLAINRHLKEIDSLPFYNSLLFHANPRPAISIDLPDLKMIISNISQIPHQTQQNPSSDQIHQHFIRQIERPRVERNNPASNWSHAWRNIASRRLTAAQRTKLYLFVNEKTPHRKLLFEMRRVEHGNCIFCGDHTAETLHHKFSTCVRVGPAWTFFQQKIQGILGGWRRLAFEDLIRPVLSGISDRQKVNILEMLVKYLCFIEKCNARIDKDEVSSPRFR
jgi:hypothetical protein